MARAPDPCLPDLWRRRLMRQAQSGTTIAQFCLDEGVSTTSFHAWKRRLRIDDAPVPSPSLSPTPTPSPFLPVHWSPPREPEGPRSIPIRIDLPNGVVVRLRIHEVAAASRVLRALARDASNMGGASC